MITLNGDFGGNRNYIESKINDNTTVEEIDEIIDYLLLKLSTTDDDNMEISNLLGKFTELRSKKG